MTSFFVTVRCGIGIEQVQFLVQFVAANALEIVMALIKELFLEESLGIFQRGRIARAHLS